ncbi:MAG: hypothetical protein GY731_10195, partial [Gammaproteobacteria bacterium]|nr:hypothetical protein [Gammaproteobacteria bacterium]
MNTDTASKPTRGAIAYFSVNEQGRDFVVGDIHGMFSHLELLLEEIDFDRRCDRLFSVGDLVDRGPASKEALRWLGYDWFHACRGNHEQFAIDSTDYQELEFWTRQNGGRWWLDLTLEEQNEFRKVFRQMPLVIEVETNSGVVGIVHADVPPSLSWERFCEL